MSILLCPPNIFQVQKLIHRYKIAEVIITGKNYFMCILPNISIIYMTYRATEIKWKENVTINLSTNLSKGI